MNINSNGKFDDQRSSSYSKRDKRDDRLNLPMDYAIKSGKVRVVDGDQTRIMSKDDAIAEAKSQGKNLVQIAFNPSVFPGSICKILDYGKFRFDKQKKAREAKKNQKVTEVKALRLSPVIDVGDFDTKVKQASKWLAEGNKVKVDMRFRGRMMTRQDVGKKIMESFIEQLSEVANVDKQPTMEGNTMSCILSPVRK